MGEPAYTEVRRPNVLRVLIAGLGPVSISIKA